MPSPLARSEGPQMRTRKACALPFALLALATVAFGNDTWRKKSYSQWNEKEVRQILENSAWAHRVKLMVVKPAASGRPCPSGNPRCSPDSAPTIPSAYGRRRSASPEEIRASQDQRSASPTPPGLQGVAATAVVRWASARTVREAVARDGVQRGLVKPEELKDASFFAPLDTYVLYIDFRIPVSDANRVPQSGLFTEAMVQNAVLVVKSTGQRIAPLSVKKAPLPEFDERKELALGAFYIFFPRQVEGKPALPLDERIVRFECPTVPIAIASEFELRAMARDGSPDF